MPTRIEEYKVPKKYHPKPLFAISIEDPAIYKRRQATLFDVTVTVGHSLSGIEVHAVQSGTGRIEKIESRSEEVIIFKGRLTDVHISHKK